jgi:hypothetical protein
LTQGQLAYGQVQARTDGLVDYLVIGLYAGLPANHKADIQNHLNRIDEAEAKFSQWSNAYMRPRQNYARSAGQDALVNGIVEWFRVVVADNRADKNAIRTVLEGLRLDAWDDLPIHRRELHYASSP